MYRLMIFIESDLINVLYPGQNEHAALVVSMAFNWFTRCKCIYDTSTLHLTLFYFANVTEINLLSICVYVSTTCFIFDVLHVCVV